MAGKNREIALGFIFMFAIFVLLLSVSYASAYQRLCLTNGDVIPNASNPKYTCTHDLCQVCVTDNLYPTAPYFCNNIKGCGTLNGSGGGVDTTPPVLTVNSPVEGKYYNNRAVLFDFVSNENAVFTYIDNVNGRGRWKTLAGNTKTYSRQINFRDGAVSLTFKAKDRNGNFAEVVRNFFVDSKKPKIKNTYPKGGFTGSEFKAEYDEENLKSVILHYGNSAEGYEQAAVGGCTSGKKQTCSKQVDLSKYNGKYIDYWFEVEDMPGSKVESKHINLGVDTAAPVITNLDSFWVQGTGRNNRYVYFNIMINEPNFDSVVYSYEDSMGRVKETNLCSSLKNGACTIKKTFKTGHKVINVIVRDLAGNSFTKQIEFDVV